MKYKAEVDSENRNISPRNDLLRKRRCVGIIQAARSTHTHARARLGTMEQPRCLPTLVAAVREGRGLNQPSRCPGLRQRCRSGAELSGAERGGDSEVGRCRDDSNQGIQIPFLLGGGWGWGGLILASVLTATTDDDGRSQTWRGYFH